jgi:hypothetical protein
MSWQASPQICTKCGVREAISIPPQLTRRAPPTLQVGTTSCLVSIITIMPSDLCRPIRFVVMISHAAPQYWTTQEKPFSRRGQAVMHTCDHQTTSLGTKADHECGSALEKASVRSKHPLFREKRIFSYCCSTASLLLGGKVC